MAHEFTIIRWNGKGAAKVIEHRKRRDTAGYVLRREIYNMLASEGLLDRPIASQLMTQAQDWEANWNRKGADGKRLFRLRENDRDVCVYIDWIR